MVGESAVAAGVRRIEALTGRVARKHADELAWLTRAVASELRAPVAEAPDRLAALLEDRRSSSANWLTRARLALSGGGEFGAPSNIEEISRIRFYRLAVSGLGNNELKSLADEGKAKVSSGVVAVANTSPDAPRRPGRRRDG